MQKICRGEIAEFDIGQLDGLADEENMRESRYKHWRNKRRSKAFPSYSSPILWGTYVSSR